MNVYNTRTKSERISVKNPTNKPISVSFAGLSKFINVKMVQNPIPAKA